MTMVQVMEVMTITETALTMGLILGILGCLNGSFRSFSLLSSFRVAAVAVVSALQKIGEDGYDIAHE